MEWPAAQAPAAVLPTPRLRSRTPSIDLDRFVPTRPAAVESVSAHNSASAPLARAVVTSSALDRGTLTVTLVNWMILLALFCTFILATVAGSSDAQISGSPAGTTATATR